MTEDLVLKLEIAPGQVPNAENVANVLLAYVEMLRVAASVVEPESKIEVGLAGVEDGSDVFRLTLRRMENAGGSLLAGMSDYPLLSKALIALAGMTATSLVTIALTATFAPDPRIPDDQMRVFEEQRRLLEESVSLQRQQMRFYSLLHEEPAIERIDVMRGGDRSLVYSVPQHEFVYRGGLWSGLEDAMEQEDTQPRTEVWDVVLIKAVLIPEPRRWSFSRDGAEFSARMDDQRFLDALRNKSLQVALAEGIRMSVEVKFREEMGPDGWIAVKGSHRITQVLQPLPPAPSSPLFP